MMLSGLVAVFMGLLTAAWANPGTALACVAIGLSTGVLLWRWSANKESTTGGVIRRPSGMVTRVAIGSVSFQVLSKRDQDCDYYVQAMPNGEPSRHYYKVDEDLGRRRIGRDAEAEGCVLDKRGRRWEYDEVGATLLREGNLFAAVTAEASPLSPTAMNDLLDDMDLSGHWMQLATQSRRQLRQMPPLLAHALCGAAGIDMLPERLEQTHTTTHVRSADDAEVIRSAARAVMAAGRVPDNGDGSPVRRDPDPVSTGRTPGRRRITLD